jgi:hypothetical protein
MLLCASFAEVGCNWKSLYAAMRSACGTLLRRFSKDSESAVDDVFDPVPEHERVPFWAWGSLLVVSTIVTCVVMGVQFGQNVGVTLLGVSKSCWIHSGARLRLIPYHTAIVFSFLFSFIGCESAGRTNINPVTSIGELCRISFIQRR